jgi:hypothetical protein
MFKQKQGILSHFALEGLSVVTIAFMIYWPAEYGLFVLYGAIALVLSLKLIQVKEREANPAITQFQKEIEELKNKVEQIILRGNR